MNTKTLLTLTAATIALALPSTANAGYYTVHSCDAAGGAQNAWGPTADSWMTAYSICPSLGDWGRGIVARNAVANVSTPIANGAAARQFFTSPDTTGIVNVRFSGQIYRAYGTRWNVGLSNGSTMLAGVSAATYTGYEWNPVDQDVAVPWNQTVYWEAACFSSNGCNAQSTGDAAAHYVRAGIWIRSTSVTIDDPTLPNVAWRGSLLSGTWVRGDQNFNWDDNDNSGISNTTATLAGRTIVNQSEGCDYSRPQPCPSGAAGNHTISTTGWPDGGHNVHITVTDASGNQNGIDGAVYIDNTAPTRPSGPTVQGGENWRPTNSFKLTWTNPGGQAAPITTRYYKLCPTDGGACTTGQADGGQQDITLSVPSKGTWKAQVWLGDQAGNQNPSSASDPVTLRFDDTVPAATKITTPGEWIGSEAAKALPVTLTLTDGATPPISGIAGYSTTTNGADPDATTDTDSTWSPADMPEGTQTLKARAISGSGKTGPTVTRTVKVDRTAPTADATGLPDPGLWQDQAVTLQLTAADQQSGAAGLQWQLDNGPAQDATGDKTQLTISDDGKHTLTWEAIDKAGNHSKTKQAVIRIDRSGPDTVTMLQSDPANPRKIVAAVSDKGSGVHAGVIQLRPIGGAWRDLDTTLTDDADRLTAQLDDTTLAKGSYQLRATATDNVGNSRTSSNQAIELPIRSKSTLALNFTAASGTNRWVSGRVLGADGKPLAGAPVTVLAKPRTSTTWKTERTIRTDTRGRFRYHVPTGPSRTLRFTYQGTDTVRPDSADHTQLTKASTTIRASRRSARVGQTITFTGRLKGRPIPTDGKVLALQAFDGGRWRNFPQVVTTNKAGRWTTSLKFERTQGIYTYKIRARIFRDSSYPYETGVSRTIYLTVRGH